MLYISKKNTLSIFFILGLSFNTFAKTELNEKTSSSEKSGEVNITSNNVFELFKVKDKASEYIKNIEEKLRTTDYDEQKREDLLVELAQSLLYYDERHYQDDNINDQTSKVILSKETSSKVSSTKVSRSKVNNGQNSQSNIDSSNNLNEKNIILNKALAAYKNASELSLKKNRIKYTRQLSELTVRLNKKSELVQIFNNLLQQSGDEKGTYLAHVDYADGLAKFKDNMAGSQFLSAINMRTQVDGVEANFRFAHYLLENDKAVDALNILDKFSFEERRMYVHIAMLRQKTMHLLNMDTQEVDTEIEQIRKTMSGSPWIVDIPKFSAGVKNAPENVLGLLPAYAMVRSYTHNNRRDDSRSQHHSMFMVPKVHGKRFSAILVNAAEVVYNEARDESFLGRLAIAWAIRNRAMINMKGCDSYPGAEGHHEVEACRNLSPVGEQPKYEDAYQRYNCAIHGGTTKVGSPNFQMNDRHVSYEILKFSGILWEIHQVMNGDLPDPTSPYSFVPSKRDVYTGNPDGAQEWSKKNYCANNYSCKVRLGNVGGHLTDPGNLCPEDGDKSTDNFFWGRKNFYDLVVETEMEGN